METMPKETTNIIPVVENLNPDPGYLCKGREIRKVEEGVGLIITDKW